MRKSRTAPPPSATNPQPAPGQFARPASPAIASSEIPPSPESFPQSQKTPRRFRTSAPASWAIRMFRQAYPRQPLASSRATLLRVAPDHVPQENHVSKNIDHQQHVFRKTSTRPRREPASARVINSPQAAQDQQRATQRLHISQREVQVALGQPLDNLVLREKKRERQEREKKEDGQIVQPFQPHLAGAHAAGLRDDGRAPAQQAEIDHDSQHRLGSGHWKWHVGLTPHPTLSSKVTTRAPPESRISPNRCRIINVAM